MTTTESGDASVSTGLMVLFSQAWCLRAVELWDEVVFPNLVDPGNYHYSAEFVDTDTGAVCQFTSDTGRIITWQPGKHLSDDDCHFILLASRDNWRKVAEGKLDPVGAVASKRIHLKKGPMPVVIKEADAFKRLLVSWGRIPTDW
jgi:putative sterol carrier protein